MEVSSMAATSALTEAVSRPFVKPAAPASFPNTTSLRVAPCCARCNAAWHIGAVRFGEEPKHITFAQLEKMAEGVLKRSTLRTYSRSDKRGANYFGPFKRKRHGEVRYDACAANAIIERERGGDVQTLLAAIDAYDAAAPTTETVLKVEQKLREEEREIHQLRGGNFPRDWWHRWVNVNALIARCAKWIDETNRDYGLAGRDGLFITNRFRNRRDMIRSAFPDFSDRVFETFWRRFERFLRYEEQEHLIRALNSGEMFAEYYKEQPEPRDE